MKILKAFKRMKFTLALLALSMFVFFCYSLYIKWVKKHENKQLYDMRRFLYEKLNQEQMGIWDNKNSIFFSNSQGHGQYKFLGDAEYFAASNFEQGVYSLAISLNEKYKISTTNLELQLKDGYYIKNKYQMFFPDQLVEIEYIKASRSYYKKTCMVSASAFFEVDSSMLKKQLKIKFESLSCNELNRSLTSHVSFTEIKENQVLFHILFCLFILTLQIFCVYQIDEALQRSNAFSQQISIMSVLTLATFQLFNGFEHFILSVMGYPYFLLIMVVGILFMLSFFYMIIRLMSVILQRQVNHELERNPNFSMRTYLLFSYLLCHTTILASFYFSIECSDSFKIYVYWCLALLPQIFKNLVSDFGFLESNRYLSLFYFSVILFSVYQHFYKNNFSWVSNQNGFNQIAGMKILAIALFMVGFEAVQEAFNIQRFFNTILYGKNWEYFHTIEEIKTEKGIDLSAFDCNICLSNIENEQESEDWKEAIESEELKEYIAQNKDKPVMVCPCKHIFHSSCLLTWMCVKMECPTCRAKLIPLV